MRKGYLVIICVLAVTLWAAAVQASIINIVTAASGWNADEVLANSDPINQTVDYSYATWAETGYTAANGTISPGLPVSGSFVSPGSGATYTFQPYGSDDALRMGFNSSSSSGILTVVPGEYSRLYILATSGDGNAPASATSNITLNFSDGSTDTYDNALYAPDWYSVTGGSASVALGSLQRILVGNNNIDTGTGANFQLYESILNLTGADQDKTLVSITFNDPPGRSATSVYALDGDPAPLPPSVLLLGSGLAGLAGLGWRWRRKTA